MTDLLLACRMAYHLSLFFCLALIGARLLESCWPLALVLVAWMPVIHILFDRLFVWVYGEEPPSGRPRIRILGKEVE